MAGCAASKRVRLTLAVGKRSLSVWGCWRGCGEAPEHSRLYGGCSGAFVFRRLRVVRGLLVCGCHGVDGHDVDEAVDFVNDALVVRFLRPVEIC